MDAGRAAAVDRGLGVDGNHVLSGRAGAGHGVAGQRNGHRRRNSDHGRVICDVSIAVSLKAPPAETLGPGRIGLHLVGVVTAPSPVSADEILRRTTPRATRRRRWHRPPAATDAANMSALIMAEAVALVVTLVCAEIALSERYALVSSRMTLVASAPPPEIDTPTAPPRKARDWPRRPPPGWSRLHGPKPTRTTTSRSRRRPHWRYRPPCCWRSRFVASETPTEPPTATAPNAAAIDGGIHLRRDVRGVGAREADACG